MDTPTFIGLTTGITGSLTGVASFVWLIFRWRTEVLLRIDVRENCDYMGNDLPYPPPGPFLAVTLANIGTRPIGLSVWGLETDGKGDFIPRAFLESIPKRMEPGDSCVAHIEHETIEKKIPVSELTAFIITDTRGKAWRCTRKWRPRSAPGKWS